MRNKAVSEGINNLSFVSCDGIDYPFVPGTFDLTVTRYSMHHFPDIEHSIGEVSRVLKRGGTYLLFDLFAIAAGKINAENFLKNLLTNKICCAIIQHISCEEDTQRFANVSREPTVGVSR
ncbi:MAG: class I SAM-dependent methyltransferase [Ruminiclostridium sp.]|nr:class I SAM-dependent methyltransferase [Ruminiclostridium sp.]